MPEHNPRLLNALDALEDGFYKHTEVFEMQENCRKKRQSR